MSDLYDVKISVRSSVKLLPEIKGLLSMKPNHERSFKDTVFESWLDIQSHKNNTHMMHYVFQPQVNIRFYCTSTTLEKNDYENEKVSKHVSNKDPVEIYRRLRDGPVARKLGLEE
ncbi:hypothetical protein Tco_0581157 [Tanacetum coccineum]